MTETAADVAAEPEPPAEPRGMNAIAAMLERHQNALNSILVGFLAVATALLVGALLMVFSDPDTLGEWRDFFDHPGQTLSASWDLVYAAYVDGLWQSSLGTWRGRSETLLNATPLIFTGLSVSLAFRSGLFNIGGEGQVLMGAMAAVYAAFTFDSLPLVLHLPLTVGAAIVGGAVWAGIAGILKATRGAHEVISTIMLNFIALQLVSYALTTETFRREGRSDPISKEVPDSAQFPALFGSDYRATWAFVAAIVAAALVWWILFRSTLGFRLRMVGANPNAARYAGISVGVTIVIAMFLAGSLSGMAGASNVLGVQNRLTGGFTNFGFTGIAVALVGRSHPAGVVAAGLLFGILQAGSLGMQAQTSIPVDIIVVIQAFVILFVSAPKLVREIFRIKVTEEGPAFGTGWGQ